MRRRQVEPRDPLGQTREFPPPGQQRPLGTPLPGYHQQQYPPGPPPRDNAARGWMAAFFVLLFGVIAAVVVWLVVLRDGGSGTVELSTPVVDFGDQDLGKRSAVQTISIDNGSDEPVRIASITIQGENANDFETTDETTCSTQRALDAGATCTIGVRFRPSARDDRRAEVSIRLAQRQTPLLVALHGRGVGEASVVLETTRLDLGSVLIGKARTRRFTLTNAGNAPLEIREISIEGENAGDFRVARATDCSVEERLPAGRSCTIAVSFRPSETGARRANVTIAHDAEGQISAVELRGDGRGVTEVGVEPDALDFGQVEVGSTGGPQSFTVTNTGTARFVVATIEIDGGDAGSFAIESSSTCAPDIELSPGDTCTVDVSFSPVDPGPATADVEVANRGGRRASVAVSGSGTAPPPPTTTGTTTGVTATG